LNISFLKFELKFFVFEFWKKVAIPPERNGKKKNNRFWNLNWTFGHTTRGDWKNWNMPRKFEMKKLKIFIFEIWINFFEYHHFLSFLEFEINKIEYFIYEFEMKISVWNKKMKLRNNIFCLCHRYKTFNITPILSILPMYTTLYHRCKFWWYTINLNCRILSYWFFSNKMVYDGMVHCKRAPLGCSNLTPKSTQWNCEHQWMTDRQLQVSISTSSHMKLQG
jgi:hypothetical protein